MPNPKEFRKMGMIFWYQNGKGLVDMIGESDKDYKVDFSERNAFSNKLKDYYTIFAFILPSFIIPSDFAWRGLKRSKGTKGLEQNRELRSLSIAAERRKPSATLEAAMQCICLCYSDVNRQSWPKRHPKQFYSFLILKFKIRLPIKKSQRMGDLMWIPLCVESAGKGL